MLQSLPSARDPWVVLQMTPSVQVDRENVGGVESGQQSSFQSKGSTTQEWTVDGMQITDRNSGGSPGYYDFDSFEEMNISTGMLDVEHRDPGIVINLVTRRGGNKTSLGGRFFFTDEQFQAKISPERLAELGVAALQQGRRHQGLRLQRRRPGLQGQDLVVGRLRHPADQHHQRPQRQRQDLPEQLHGQGQLPIDSRKPGRNLLPGRRQEEVGPRLERLVPRGLRQRSNFHFGNPTYKFQDEHMFGDNLFLSVRARQIQRRVRHVARERRKLDEAGVVRQRQQPLVQFQQRSSIRDRPHPYSVFQVQYFDDNLLGTGTSHEVKLGVEINNNQPDLRRRLSRQLLHHQQLPTVKPSIGTATANIDVVRDTSESTSQCIQIGNNDQTYYRRDEPVRRLFQRLDLLREVQPEPRRPRRPRVQLSSTMDDDVPLQGRHRHSLDKNQANYAAIAKSIFTGRDDRQDRGPDAD